MSVELFTSKGRDAQIVRLVVNVCNLTPRCHVNLSDVVRPRLKTESIELEGISTVCRHLVLLNDAIPPLQLLGGTSETAAQVRAHT